MTAGRRAWTRRIAALGATSVFVVSAGLVALAVVVGLRSDHTERVDALETGLALGVVAVVAVGISALSAVAAVAEPRNASGWIFGCVGLAFAAKVLTSVYLSDSESIAAGDLRALDAAIVADRLAVPVIVLAMPFVLLLASARPRPRPRRALAVTLIAAASAVSSFAAVALSPEPLGFLSRPENPIGVDALEPFQSIALVAWVAVALAIATLALTSLPFGRGEAADRRLRWRRKDQEAKSAWHFLRDFPRVLPYLKPYWRLAIASIGLLGVAVVAGLVSPWPLAILIDTVLGNKPLPSLVGFLGDWDKTALLVLAVVAGLVVTAAENLVGVAQSYVNTKLEQRMALDVRADAFEHAQRLSQAYHDSVRTGGLMFAINMQAHSVGQATVSIPPILQSIGLLVGMFVIVLQIDAQLALISMSVIPLVYYATRFYAKHIEPRLYRARNMEGESLSIVHEAMLMLRVIAAFGREKYEYARFRTQAERAVDARVDVTVRETVFALGVNVTTAIGTALVLGFGGWKVLQGEMTAGELLVVMAYVAAIYQPLEEVTGTIASLQEQFIGMRMVLDVLDTEPEIKDAPDAVPLTQAAGHVTFESVSFSHSGREGTLVDVSFDAPSGSRIGIVGKTGAGKTTLVTLIPRFYDVDQGRVLVDGHDVRDVTLQSLRWHMSIVHQQPMLFAGSIAENIRYGRLEARDDEVVEAARAANADEFISALPDGYATHVGEGGAQLSGGERQRIAIARAFLKDAPILILDEPTASIDSKTEGVILDTLERLAVGRTTFVVAHRLATLGDPDLILVVDAGRIVERGTREELVARNGLFRELYDAQTFGRRLRVIERDLTPPTDAAAAAADERAADAVLADSLRRLVHSPTDALNRLATDRSQPLEVRLAAGILAALTREELDQLGELDAARLAAALREGSP